MLALRIIAFFLLLAGSVGAQDVTKKDLDGKRWIVENKSESFYHKDTLILYQIPNDAEMIGLRKSDKKSFNPIDVEELFGHSEYVKLNLQKNKWLRIANIFYQHAEVVPSNLWSWSFDERRGELSFYKGNILEHVFRVIGFQKMDVPIRIANKPPTKLVYTLRMVRVTE